MKIMLQNKPAQLRRSSVTTKDGNFWIHIITKLILFVIIPQIINLTQCFYSTNVIGLESAQHMRNISVTILVNFTILTNVLIFNYIFIYI